MAQCKICGGHIACGCNLSAEQKAAFLASGLCITHWKEERTKTASKPKQNVR